MNLQTVKEHFREKGNDYTSGRAMALSFKPLTIEDVRDAYHQAVEDIFASGEKGMENMGDKEYYVLREDNGFLRMLYRCRTIEGVSKHLPEGLTQEHLLIMLDKGMGSIRYEYDEKTTYHILTIEKWDKIDSL